MLPRIHFNNYLLAKLGIGREFNVVQQRQKRSLGWYDIIWCSCDYKCVMMKYDQTQKNVGSNYD